MIYIVNNEIQNISQKTQFFLQNDSVSITQDTSALSEFVRQTMKDKGLTAREVERLSNKKITHSYVNKIKNGDAKNPSPSILQALARGLGEPEAVLFDLVRGIDVDETTITNERFSEMAKVYVHLPEEQREMIDPIIDALETTVNNYWRKTWVFIVKNVITGVSDTHKIKFEYSYSTEICNRSTIEANVWEYYVNATNIVIIRWLNKQVSVRVYIDSTYINDFSKGKLEKDVNIGVENLLKLPSLTIYQESLVSSFDDLYPTKNSDEESIDEFINNTGKRLKAHFNVYELNSPFDLEKGIEKGFRRFVVAKKRFK